MAYNKKDTSIKSPYQLNPKIAKQVDELVEAKKRELKRQQMASKLKKTCGDQYGFILFDIETKPQIGDTMRVFDMKAVWRKDINNNKK
jgi:muconolactone delta-isomerase